MSVAPHAGIVDFGAFTPPGLLADGIQGAVPAPLVAEAGYVLSTTGWISAEGASGNSPISVINAATRLIQTQKIMAQMALRGQA